MREDICAGSIMMWTILVFRGYSRSINTKSERNHKDQSNMAYDTDNNFPVSGASGEALIATDYSGADSAHYQVMKIAFGPKSSAEPTRVQSGSESTALPVKIENASVAVSGSFTLNSGATVSIPTGVTVSGGTMNFRRLSAIGATFGIGYTQGGASGATYDYGFDSIRVMGICGAFPVSVVGTAFDVRKLSAIGSTTASGITGGGSFGDSSIDTLRVIGFSGAYPVETLLFGVTGISGGGSYAFGKNNRVPLRVDSTGSLSVNIETFPTTSALPVTVNKDAYASGGTMTNAGFPIRILRATRGGIPVDTAALIENDLSAEGNAEDTVRVVGFSGAYPVESMLFGLTRVSGGSGDRVTRVPLKVDEDGNLRVSVAVGTIGVTATVSGVTIGGQVVIGGICLNHVAVGSTLISTSGITGYSQVLQVQGYKFGWSGGGATVGYNPIPITTEVTGSVGVNNAAGTSLAVNGAVAVSNASIAVTNSTITNLNGAIVGSGTDASVRMSADSTLSGSLTNTATALSGLCGSVKTLSDVFVTSGGNNVIAEVGGVKSLRVSVADVVQPSAVTAGRVGLSTTEGIQLGSFGLESGVNLRSDLRNTTQTIFVSNTAVGASGGLGFPLYNGDQIFIETDNLNKIFVASTPAGATLYYIGS